MSDAEALGWLDKLLAETDEGRDAALSALATRDPALHARLKRLLTSALAPEQTRVFAQPVVAGLAHVSGDITRALAPGDVLAGYRLIRELGRGGMAVVWLAERADGSIKREVAFKIPMFLLQGAAEVERFARERDALAALSHPHVARLYDAGVLASGQPFIVLERVDGVPLTAFCDAHALDLRARAKLFLQVLGAVEHAHRHLVVHRDLKPSNILVDTDGQVKLLDFGIAKLLGDAELGAQPTQTGAMTPLYAAPEQLRNQAISTLTDVFALGLLLHESLTGVLPYRGVDGQAPTLIDVLEALRQGELPRASQAPIDERAAARRAQRSAAKLRGALAGDLDTIIGKALRLAPEARYASATHFADDLKRWLDSQPIAARPPSLWYATRLAYTRHRTAATVAGVGALLVAGAGVVAYWQRSESRAHEARAAAVRDFMFDLVNDAEADDSHTGGEVTGRQMVEGAVRRARRDFTTQPRLQGELLGELGRMYIRLGAPESAVPVLGESIGLLEKAAEPADPALNKSRVYLADALLQSSDDIARMRALATQARTACSDATADCAKARAYASNILSQLTAATGDSAGALAEMRASVADTVRGFGETNAETAMAWVSLATIARNAGNLTEAGEAVRKAVASAEGQKLRAADRATLDRTVAVLDLDLGRFAAARDRLTALIAVTPAPAERALLSRLLANAQLELGNGADALRAADAALELLPAADADQRLYARQARANALSLLGDHAGALQEIDAVIASFIGSGSAPDSFVVLRARRIRADLLLRSGADAAALAELRALRSAHEQAEVSAVERGLALTLLGRAEARAGNATAARAAYDAAQSALGRQLPATHEYITRNAAARAAADDTTTTIQRENP